MSVTYSKADQIVSKFISALVDERTEVHGYSLQDANSYTLGYVGSKLTSILCELDEKTAIRILKEIDMISKEKTKAIDNI